MEIIAHGKKLGFSGCKSSASGYGKIGVLMGGPSSEREISLKSGKAIYKSLQDSGVTVVTIDITTDDQTKAAKLISDQKIDCAFIALHGRFGEDGQIQRILDSLGVPYTGSGVLSSSLAMDKIASRGIFASRGIKVPKYNVLKKKTLSKNYQAASELKLPLVIKPATHGSSIGLSIIENIHDLPKAIDFAFSFDERIIIEEYIQGRELTVGVLNEEALPVIEIIPKNKFFDYQAKYSSGMTDYIVPAVLEEPLAKKVQESGLSAHKSLGCYGCSRADIILSQDNTPFVLEVNTIPGFTSTSLLPKAAKLIGIEFNQLCLKLIQLAYAKTPLSSNS